MIAFVTTLFNALAAIPTLINAVESFAGAVASWYIARQKAQTLSMIMDSTALLAQAQSDPERFTAIEALQKALSRTRYIGG